MRRILKSPIGSFQEWILSNESLQRNEQSSELNRESIALNNRWKNTMQTFTYNFYLQIQQNKIAVTSGHYKIDIQV